MISMRAVPIAASITLGLTLSASAQTLGPGGAPPQQRVPACLEDFAPLCAQAERHATAIKTGMEKKVPREEVCVLYKQFSAAEAMLVRFVEANSPSCGIPPEAGAQIKANHSRTLRTLKQVCGQSVDRQRHAFHREQE